MIMCVFLISCETAEEPVEEEKETVTTEPEVKIYEQVDEAAGETVEEIAKPAEKEYPEMSEELQDLIAKADKVESIEYSYVKHVSFGAGIYMTVFVKGKQSSKKTIKSGN